MIDKVEVGKRYRLIDKEGWLSYGGNSYYNASILRRGIFDSDNCVVIDRLDGLGWGWVNSDVVISARAFPFFELVEENTESEEPKVITPETEVTITTTYGELARVYYVMGSVNGSNTVKNLFSIAADLLGDENRSIYWGSDVAVNHINYCSVQEKWESLFFKSKEQQEKELAIKQKRDMIAQLQKEIEELGGEL